MTVTRSGDKPHTTCKNLPMIQFIHGASQSHTGAEAKKTQGLHFSLGWSQATSEPQRLAHRAAWQSLQLGWHLAAAPGCIPARSCRLTTWGSPQCHTQGLLTPLFCATLPACLPNEHALPKFLQSCSLPKFLRSCSLPNFKGRNKIYMSLPNWIPPRKEFQTVCHTMAFFPPYSSAK